jgi:hypothetical protein
MASSNGKLKNRDEMIARLWKWLPWLSFFLLSLPAPIPFFILFLMASSPESAAVYLLFSVLSLGIGVLAGLFAVLLLLLLKRRWSRRLRDRLAEDGITANEVNWFTSELTSAERKTLNEIESHNPLLADAYRETLATRLTAARIIARASRERLLVERRINRARSLTGANTQELLRDLEFDHQQLENLRSEATSRLAESKARLQTIEAVASRTLNKKETEMMLQRLSESQNHFPLALELIKLQRDVLQEAEGDLKTAFPAPSSEDTIQR